MTQTKGASITEPCSLWACITLTLRSIIIEFSCVLSNMIIPLYWNYPMTFVLNVIGNRVCSQNPVPFAAHNRKLVTSGVACENSRPTSLPARVAYCLV